jgi:hypothetical protein
MSLGISIDLRDTLSPTLARLRRGIEPKQLAPTIGEAGVRGYKRHFARLNRERPNRLGGKRTNYYAAAARGTNFQVVSDGVVIGIDQPGIRLRYFGGTIRPKPGKTYLTIPVHPAAHGKTAREFDLEVIFGKGGRPIALATKGRAAKGNGRARLGEIYFLLLREVTVKEDPSVLLRPDELAGQILPEAQAYLERLIERGGSA